MNNAFNYLISLLLCLCDEQKRLISAAVESYLKTLGKDYVWIYDCMTVRKIGIGGLTNMYIFI